MNHFDTIAAALEDRGLDAMLLTGEANRFYASGFHSSGTDGVSLVTRSGAYYFTDSRYIEAAGRYVQGAVIEETRAGRGYGVLLEEVIQKEGLKRVVAAGVTDGSRPMALCTRLEAAMMAQNAAQ